MNPHGRKARAKGVLVMVESLGKVGSCLPEKEARRVLNATRISCFGPFIAFFGQLTFQGREASVENELEVAELPFGEDDGRELLGFFEKLLSTRCISGDEVFQNAACTVTISTVALLDVHEVKAEQRSVHDGVRQWGKCSRHGPCGGFAMMVQ